MCPGGEIGRRTGLKILGPVTVVPVQVWPGAPQIQSPPIVVYSPIREEPVYFVTQ